MQGRGKASTNNSLRESRGGVGADTGARGPEIELRESLKAVSQLAPIGPDLARVIDAWPTLPEHVRQSITTLADAAADRSLVTIRETATTERSPLSAAPQTPAAPFRSAPRQHTPAPTTTEARP